MSKQTMDSLEHSEKRAEAAEKVSISNDGVHRQLADPQQEVLVLRDREGLCGNAGAIRPTNPTDLDDQKSRT